MLSQKANKVKGLFKGKKNILGNFREIKKKTKKTKKTNERPPFFTLLFTIMLPLYGKPVFLKNTTLF